MRTELDVVVVLPEGVPATFADRTQRALGGGGVVVAERALGQHLERAREPVWLLRASAWPSGALPRPPPASATGRTLVALGATCVEGPDGVSSEIDHAWRTLLAETGGDLARAARLPRVDSVLVEEPHRLAYRLAGSGFDAAVGALARDATTRTVRLASLDVGYGAALRVVEVVTTLHRGGAERVVLDLVRELRARGAHVVLAVLDHASRTVLRAPEGTVDLTAHASTRAGRIEALAALAREAHADVVHVHLADGAEVKKLAGDVPIVLTLHNDRAGWAAHTTSLGPDDVAMVLACSADVARALSDAVPALASRTRVAWNGIEPEAGAGRAELRADLRAELGVPASSLLVAVVANHRPQKRLERVPEVVAELVRRGRDVHAAIVGEPVGKDAASSAVAGRVRGVAEELGVAERVHVAGTREEAGAALAGADVVLGTSAFEGLSLVHLEAMRARRPLVTTAVSGTEEIAALHAGVWRVPVDAGAAAFADAIEAATAEGAPRPERLASPFMAGAMAERHLTLLSRARAQGRRRGGVVLVANNFATGGAQSSARRLLVGLQAVGVPVAAAVIQEQAGYPTTGRAALVAAGVPVLAAPRAGAVDPAVTAEAVARFVDEHAPEAVVFWNAITQHKVLIAELLAGTPVWDVSPGEMCFTSLERYFEKPRAGHPVRDARAYGRMLAGVVVKYAAERARAEDALGAPVHVVPNGVAVGELPARPGGGERVVVGTLARINPDKRLDQLVRAVRHAVARRPALGDRIEVRIAGPVEQGCEEHAAELRALAEGLPIVFVGEQASEAFLAGLDLFAMISEPSGCPNASLEAMAAGLAVLATDVGGARDQVADGETGLVVARGDEAAFGEALASLVEDAPRRAAMGRAAHGRARERFSVERMVADYRRVLLGE